MNLVSPVLLKEFRVILRSRVAYWLLLGLLIVVGGTFWLFWLTETRNASLGARTQFSRTMFLALTVVQLTAFGIISPVMTATAVTSERENRTLDLLYCTGLSRIHLLLGKWFSAIAYQLLLIACLMPVLALVFQLGGVGLDEYLTAAVMITLTVLTYGMTGLAFSCLSRKTTTALIASLVTVLILGGLAPLLILLLSRQLTLGPMVAGYFGSRGNSSSFLLDFIGSMSPITTWFSYDVLPSTSVGAAAGPSAGGFLTIFITHPMFRAHLIIQTVIFTVSACVAWIAFARRDAGRLVSAQQIIDDPKILRRRRLHWPYYLIDPRRRPQEIGDNQNPVFVKEKRVGALAKNEALIRGSYIGLAFSLLLVFRTSIRPDSFDAMKDLALWAIGFIIVFMPILAATSVSKEREENTMDLLRATMLTSWQIVWAKFLIALRFLSVLGLSVVIIPAAVRIVVPSEGWVVGGGFLVPQQAPVTPVKMFFSFLDFLRVAPFVLAFAALYAAVGTAVSCWVRRNATAIIVTYLLVLVLLLAPTLPIYVAGLLEGLAAGDQGLDSSVSPGLMAWPLHWFLHYFCPLISPYWYFTDHGLYPHAFRHWQNLIQIVLHTALVLALTGLLLRAGASRLNASQ